MATGPGLRASSQHFNRTNQDFTVAQLLATETEPVAVGNGEAARAACPPGPTR